jgi:hypothetical protein
VCAGIVLAGTDFGGARRRLAALFAALSADIAGRFAATLAMMGSTLPETMGSTLPETQPVMREIILQQPVRRELIRQVIALEPVIDEVIGESSTLGDYSPALGAAVAGLFAALAAWRTVVARLMRLSGEAARQDAEQVLRSLPEGLRPPEGDTAPWTSNPSGMRQLCDAGIRNLIAIPARTPSLRLLADHTAGLLAGLSRVLDGLALLVADPARLPFRGRVKVHVPDWLPAAVNAARAFATIGAVEVFWIVTAWPNGALAVTWAAISVMIFAPRADQAYPAAMSFMLGTALAAVCAAILDFACLPNVETFAGFSLWMGLYLVPVGALMAQPWQAMMFAPMVGNFIPLLGPANEMSYDTLHFYNTALAIVAGCGAAALSFRLLPGLSPALRTRRLLQLSLRDLRRLATDPVARLRNDWEGRMHSRLAALPDEAEPLQRSQLVAVLRVGSEVIHLRRTAPHFSFRTELDSALRALAQGDSATAIARLADLDQRLASRADPKASFLLRERGSILAVSDALTQHHAYFDEGAPG